LVRKRGLRNVNLLRRARKTKVLGQGSEIAEMTKFHEVLNLDSIYR
jgi:hypothetical protein